MNKPAKMFATTFLFICLVFLCANPAYCEVNKTAEALTARIKALLELEGKPFFDERDKLIEEWSADVAMLEELQGQLPPIAKAVAGGLIARIRYPDLMKELDEKHYEALRILVNPPVLFRDAGGSPYPETYPESAYFIVGTERLEKTMESRIYNTTVERTKEYRRYLDRITLPDNDAIYAFLVEIAIIGIQSEIIDKRLLELYKNYGNYAQWKAWQVIQELCYERGMLFPEDLLFEVCKNTKALDSPGVFLYVTEYSLSRKSKINYHLLAQEKYQEMVRRTKILGDPDRKIPPLPKDALYYRYFEEIVKYVEENPQPTPTPIPTLIPSPAPTQKPVQAEPQNKAGEVQKGSAWFLILAASIAAVILIAVVVLLRRRKTH